MMLRKNSAIALGFLTAILLGSCSSSGGGGNTSLQDAASDALGSDGSSNNKMDAADNSKDAGLCTTDKDCSSEGFVCAFLIDLGCQNSEGQCISPNGVGCSAGDEPVLACSCAGETFTIPCNYGLEGPDFKAHGSPKPVMHLGACEDGASTDADSSTDPADGGTE
jgi:hypothetical protein